jgi:hypothetical protein
MAEYLDLPAKGGLNETNLLFNKNKISDEIASLSSMSSISNSSSIYNNISKKNKKLINPSIIDNNNNIKIEKKKRVESDSNSSASGSERGGNKKKEIVYEVNDDDEDDEEEGEEGDEDDENEEEGDEEEGDEDDEEEGDEDDDEEGGNKRKITSYKDIQNEKKEILYQLNRLSSKGARIPHNFTMNSNIEDMRNEYNKIVRDREIDSSIRFQRKMLMAFVTGTEYLNTRYNPFTIQLEGWSEQVHENIDDFDDIFEELHLKYKSKGKAMPPELRLFISLAGSAFMFHLTSKMFKECPIPGVEEVLKANPELMKQFQNAAAKQFIYNNMGSSTSNTNTNTTSTIQQPQNSSSRQMSNSNNNSGGGGINGLFSNPSGLFGMVNNLFSGLNNIPKPPDNSSMNSNRNNNNKSFRSENDINNIINNVHNNISLNHNDDDGNKIETLSISDEEITSIIEDAADIKILKSSTRGKKSNNSRTLNI